MNAQDAPAGIIYQQAFDTYTNEWAAIVATAAAELNDSFHYYPAGADAKMRVPYVTFSALHIAQLVSTVGAKHIKARFLIVRDSGNNPHFALALFATDDLNGRLSAYYVSDNYWSQPTELSLTDSIPASLVNYWLTAWGKASTITPALFNSTYGYLRGYTFELGDFLTPLGQITGQLADAQSIRINFGLHEYYPTGANAVAPLYTFGLVVQYPGPNGKQGDEDDTLFYDLSSPCPPTC